ncbi:putative RNA polymerase II nuclear localization protein SLC7A6OS-like protein [Aphelenchoides avenae]|nr:putative RNA polymerase II nuclear localization protein SLC7A6OS-like protein [Aphelenchus avenae]
MSTSSTPSLMASSSSSSVPQAEAAPTSGGENLSPSSTIIRVRRKRTAEPVSGLLVSTKRFKDEAGAALVTDAAAAVGGAAAAAGAAAMPFVYRLAGTSDSPRDVSSIASEEKVVELLDYDPESNVTGKKELSVLDDHYARLLEAMDSVETLGLDESAEKPGPSAQVEPAKAPLAQMETDGLDDGYVYDFYSTSQRVVIPAESIYVRLPTDAELQQYFGPEDESGSSDAADDDEDSNAEDYYKNDYPDEDEFREEYENDTTSDDSYDHYGDEKETYNDVLDAGDD